MKKGEINLNWRRLEPFGFKYQGMFSPTALAKGSFLKWVGCHAIYIDSSHCPQTIGFFTLTPEQRAKYQLDQAQLEPPGCCSPTAGKREIITTFQTVHTGPVKDQEHLEKILDVINAQVS